MAWIPPNCDATNFTVDGVYAPPICDSINYDMGGTAPHEILTSAGELILEGMVAEFFWGDIIESSAGEIELTGTDSFLDPLWEIESDFGEIGLEGLIHDIEILPDIVNASGEITLEGTISTIRGTEPQHLPSDTTPGSLSYSWDKSKPSDVHKRLPFGEGEDIHQHWRFPVQEKPKPDLEVRAFWEVIPAKDNVIRNPWGAFSHQDYTTLSSWIGWMDYFDNPYRKPWGSNLELVDIRKCAGYNEPGSHDTFKKVSWDTTETNDRSHCYGWNEPGSWDTEKCIPYGPFSYYTLCNLGEKYAPPRACKSIDFSFPSKYPLSGNVCEGITFQLTNFATNPDPRCPWWEHAHTGIRDRYQGIELPDIIYPPAQKVYYMLNSVLVKEIITNHPIEVLAVQAVLDRSSWLWAFQVTVASRDCLDLIRPIDGVYAHIEIEINSYKWICTVESWKENRAFGNDAWTIIGRSPSLMFAAPVASEKNYTQPDAKQGQTLFEEIVQATQPPPNWPSALGSWDADFSAYVGTGATCTGFRPYESWYIPESTLSVNDATEIETLKSLASAIGAYIQTEPDSTTLTVKPIYAHQPWDWDASNSYIDWRPINEAQCTEIARGNKFSPYYQGVHVMGEATGGANAGTGIDSSNTAVFVDVCRDGWCGGGTATYAPMSTHSLVTSSKSGLEHGRMILGNTGEWVNHTLRLGMLCPGSVSSGLFTPGDMITVLERGLPWFGQVTAVVVTAAGTGGGFSVNQQIGVEQYIGD